MNLTAELLAIAEAEHFAALAEPRVDCAGGCGTRVVPAHAVVDDLSWLPAAQRPRYHSQDCMDNAAEQAQAGTQ